MKIPLSWIKEFVDVEASPQEIARVLTMQGLEVEAVEKRSRAFSKVVVGRVISVEPHPNADKLKVAKVTDGDVEYQVVCGAPNCRAGMKSAFALPGAEIGAGEERFKIKKTKLRGVESSGMLCSQKELGIGNEEEGIIDFEPHMKEGTDLAELYADHLFEIGLTPNLSHCLSVRGVARELAAAFSRPIKKREISRELGGAPPSVSITVSDALLCPKYGAIVIEGISLQKSPKWLETRLELAGIRPINLIVDVTNFVMFEEGHPLHAFDLHKIAGNRVVVRRANKGEKLITLDGKERSLDEEAIVIADEKKLLALAGIMGGKESEVGETTTAILIESALFCESYIRKTAKREQLYTEASRRFERGVDPNGSSKALIKAATLILELMPDGSASSVLEVGEKSRPLKEIKLRLSKVNGLLGTRFSSNEVETLLKRFEFAPRFDGKDAFDVTIPSFRNDIAQEVDLIEEVARLFGYDNLGRQAPSYRGSQELSSPIYLFEREVKEKLVREGLQEFISCDLVGADLLVKCDYFPEKEGDTVVDKPISLLNPVSRDHAFLRTSLMPALLQVVKTNFDRECPDIAGFEVGRTHLRVNGRYEEPSLVAIVLSGLAAPHDFSQKPREFTFRDMRGIIDNFLASVGIDKAFIHPSKNGRLHSGRQAALVVQGLEIGTFGEVHPKILRQFDLRQKVIYAELSLEDLLKVRKTAVIMKPIIPFPLSFRDWTCILLEEAPVSQVEDVLASIPSSLLEKVFLRDIFRGGGKKKNVTFRFIYRDKEKTIEQAEVDKEHARLLHMAEELIASCVAP